MIESLPSFTTLVASLALAAPLAAQAPQPPRPGMPTSTEPKSTDKIAGDTLYISGQVARPFEGGAGMVGKDEYEQARQIFSRIDRIIKAAGGTMDNLVKMTIYVVDIRKNTEVWRARREFFSGDFPASTLVEVRSLATPDVLVEIEAVAYLGKS